MENNPEEDIQPGGVSPSRASPKIENKESGQKRRPSQNLLIVLAAAGVFLILFCACFGLSWAFVDKIPGLVGQSVGEKPPANANPLDYLEILPGDFTCTKDSSGSILVEGNVTNTSPYSIYDVVVKVALINNKGREASGNAGYFSGTVIYPKSKKPFKLFADDPVVPYTCQVKIAKASFNRAQNRELVPYDY